MPVLIAPQTSNEVDRSLTHVVGLVDSISYVASHSKKSSKLVLKWPCMRGQYERSIIIQMSMDCSDWQLAAFFQPITAPIRSKQRIMLRRKFYFQDRVQGSRFSYSLTGALYSIGPGQCDQMARLFDQFLATYNNEKFPK